MKLTKKIITATTALGIIGAANAAVTAIDLGTSDTSGGATAQVLYTGSFDGSSGFVEGTAAAANAANTDITIALGGGASIMFDNVGGWGNANSGAADVSSLLNDYIFTANNADATVTYTISGLAATDTVDVAFVGGPARSGEATFNGSGTATSAAGSTAFTVIGTAATGSTSYTGTLGNGVGEQNFAAFRVNIVSVPEPSSTALLGLGGLALILRRRK